MIKWIETSLSTSVSLDSRGLDATCFHKDFFKTTSFRFKLIFKEEISDVKCNAMEQTDCRTKEFKGSEA